MYTINSLSANDFDYEGVIEEPSTFEETDDLRKEESYSKINKEVYIRHSA